MRRPEGEQAGLGSRCGSDACRPPPGLSSSQQPVLSRLSFLSEERLVVQREAFDSVFWVAENKQLGELLAGDGVARVMRSESHWLHAAKAGSLSGCTSHSQCCVCSLLAGSADPNEHSIGLVPMIPCRWLAQLLVNVGFPDGAAQLGTDIVTPTPQHDQRHT